MAFTRIPLAAMLLSVIVSPLSGQKPNETDLSGPVLKLTSRAVVVDVQVTDNGTPVSGLSQKDFTVFEDGKPQTVDFFERHTPAGGRLSELQDLPRLVYTNQPSVAPDDAVCVLLFDNLDGGQSDQLFTRQQVAGFVANVRPGIRVAIYTLNSHLQLLQGFTSDRNQLRAAIESKSALPETIVTLRSERASIVLTALQQLARSLTAIPGRKNLVWFAGEFPVAIYPDGDNRSALAVLNGHELPEALSDTVNLLSASRIALYPVSAGGLMDATSPKIWPNIAMMNLLAFNTGGHAIMTNDLTGAVTHEMGNGAQYYTLVYTPTSAKADGKFRRIEVKLAERKYTLAYRRGYYANVRSANTTETPTDPLASLLANGLPDTTQIVYRIRVTAEPQPSAGAARVGGNSKLAGTLARYRIDFLIPTEHLSFTPLPTGIYEAKIRVAMVAYSDNGKPANWTGAEMNISLNDASYKKAQKTGITAPMEIDLPQEAVSLVTGVWDTGTQRAGTLRVSVNPKTNSE